MQAVDVIIPTRNRVMLLRRALASVLTQTHTNFAIFVANDGSTDDTAIWLSKLNHPKIKYVNIPTAVGPSAARNKAARMGTAPIISFLDDDDEYLPSHLSQCLQMLNQPSSGHFLLSSYQNETATHQFRKRRLPDFKPDATTLIWMLIYRIVIVSTSQLVVRRSAFQNINGFDSNLSCYEDHDLALRLLRHTGAELLNGFSWKKHYVATSISRSLDRLDPFLALTKNHREYTRECFGYTNAWLYRYLSKANYLADEAQRRALVEKTCSHGVNWSITPKTLAAFRQLDAAYNHYRKVSQESERQALDRFFELSAKISNHLCPQPNDPLI